MDSVRIAIVISRYNHVVTERLLEGATTALQARGVANSHTEVVWVPGAWEIPLATSLAAKSGKFDAVICLGAVIRGETTHDQHINRFVSQALGTLSLELGIPIAFGVLTCQSLEQALQRAGGAVGNKGTEAAEAALEMIQLIRTMGREK